MVSGRREWVVASIGVVAAFSLLLPWARSGDRTRSTVELMASATALDLVTGWQRVAMFVGWLVVVIAAAAGLALVAWDRPRLGAMATAWVGPALALAVAAVVASPLGLAWGGWLGSGLGATASIGSGLVVLTHVSTRKEPRE